MKIAGIVRKMIAVADRATATDLQVTVQHYAWIGDGTTYSEPLYDDPVPRLALVELRQRNYRSADGKDIVQRARITFLRPIDANGADERREPIDTRDKILLPNDYTGPIVDVIGGLDNNFSDSPYLLEVVLG